MIHPTDKQCDLLYLCPSALDADLHIELFVFAHHVYFLLTYFAIPHVPTSLLREKKQLIFAISPLIALFYVIYTGFEPEEVEKKKRSQKGDFQLDGHSE